jgi:hypothetical protein
MERAILLFLFFLTSCAHPEPKRSIASREMVIGEIDYAKSLVQLFPSADKDNTLRYYFYLQLRDVKGNFVDCSPSEILIKTNKGKRVHFDYERLLPGRYYLSLDQGLKMNSSQLDFYVGGKPLKEKFNLPHRSPDRNNTKITIIEKLDNKIVLQLRLADQKNLPVEHIEMPEIIIDGVGLLEDMKPMGPGVWEFTVTYPEDNQIIYLHVRALSFYFSNLFRYQYVDKKSSN